MAIIVILSGIVAGYFIGLWVSKTRTFKDDKERFWVLFWGFAIISALVIEPPTTPASLLIHYFAVVIGTSNIIIGAFSPLKENENSDNRTGS